MTNILTETTVGPLARKVMIGLAGIDKTDDELREFQRYVQEPIRKVLDGHTFPAETIPRMVKKAYENIEFHKRDALKRDDIRAAFECGLVGLTEATILHEMCISQIALEYYEPLPLDDFPIADQNACALAIMKERVRSCTPSNLIDTIVAKYRSEVALSQSNGKSHNDIIEAIRHSLREALGIIEFMVEVPDFVEAMDLVGYSLPKAHETFIWILAYVVHDVASS